MGGMRSFPLVSACNASLHCCTIHLVIYTHLIIVEGRCSVRALPWHLPVASISLILAFVIQSVLRYHLLLLWKFYSSSFVIIDVAYCLDHNY
eukprot:scaffold375_cov299-Chaetoceros_neogracile.AAC.7